MKRFLAILLSALMVVSMIGCGAKEEAPAKAEAPAKTEAPAPAAAPKKWVCSVCGYEVNIREDKGYTYGIGAGVVNCPGSGVLAITTEADNQYMDAIIREVYHEIDRLHNDLAPREELEMVRSYMLGDFCRSYEGPFSLSDAWIYVETAGVGDDFFVRSMDAIRNVTREEIRMMAQKYLRKETLIEVVAGKKM